MQTQNQTPLRPRSPEELRARREQGYKHSGLVEDDGMRHLERALEAAQEQPDQPSAKPPVERERFGQDTATHEVLWQSTLFGSVTIGIINAHGFGREIQLDKFTVVVPINLNESHPDTITFSIKREVTPGVRMFRSQMNAPVDCTEGEMASVTFPINWVTDQGRKMPATVKGRRDMDLIFLDTAGVGDGRKGAMVVLEVSLTTRRGQLWLGFQRVYAGQVVRTTEEKAGSIGLETVAVDHHVGSVVPLMPENAYPGSNFFGNFSHLAAGIVTAAVKLGASVPLSSCVVAHWQPSTKELPAELSGWLGANVCWFNATIGCGVLCLDDGRPVFAHFKQIEDADGTPLWRQKSVLPMLTPMTRVAVRVAQEPGKGLKATAVRPF